MLRALIGESGCSLGMSSSSIDGSYRSGLRGENGGDGTNDTRCVCQFDRHAIASSACKTDASNREASDLCTWAGSKRASVNMLLEATGELRGTYYEPFVGSACLFLALRPRRAILGDLNSDLIATYKEIVQDPVGVAAAVHRLPPPEANYYRLRAIPPATLTHLERAARFVYLNRYCFNGVYRINRQGIFNVPMGTHTGRIPSATEFEEVGKALIGARLVVRDFAKTIATVTAGDFVYLDPPF